MRCLTRNKSTFYYALYEGQNEITDEYGNSTGQYGASYSEPVQTSGNISAAQGEIQSRQFGESLIYDKVIVLDNPNIPLDEYSILWIDTLPETDETPHDYIVKKVARSLNSVLIAVSKVTVR